MNNFYFNKDINESFTKGIRYTNCEINFITNKGNKKQFKANTARDLYGHVIDWLYSDGYDFTNEFHSIKHPTRYLYTSKEVDDKILKTKYKIKDFHNIDSTDYWILSATPVKQMYGELVKMLKIHGVKDIDIKGIEGIDLLQKNWTSKNEAKTLLQAAMITLSKNNNSPMTSRQIWDYIIKNNIMLELPKGKTPWESLNTIICRHTQELDFKSKNKNNIFKLAGKTPYKFVLINDLYFKDYISLLDAAYSVLEESEMPMTVEEIWEKIKDDFEDEPRPLQSLYRNLKENSINGGYEVEDPYFKIIGTRPNEKFTIITDEDIEETKLEPEDEKFLSANSELRSENPFRQCVCILGDPGVGKSVSALNALSKAKHISYLSIPTELSASMLVKFVKGELTLNKVSKMIIEAYKFHKPLTIKRVNDELLQAISTKRYNERRFISSEVADELISNELDNYGFSEDKYSFHGNIEIPKNFGFILLSSKPNVIVNNDDLYERMDIIYIRKEDEREARSSIEGLQKSLISLPNDKKKFKQIIKSLNNDDEDSYDELNSFLNEVENYNSDINENLTNDIISFTNWRKI